MTPLSCDVLVVGGGPAGVAAAVAAARAGTRVLLLERRGVLGGSAAAGLVGTLCGLYLRGASPRLACGGFPAEVAERLGRTSGTAPCGLRNGLWVLPYEPRALERLFDRLLAEAGVELALHATMGGAEVREGRFERARALAWGDDLSVEPAAVVDATGEATATALAGGLTRDGSREQSPALVFNLVGVDPAAAGRGALPLLLALARGVKDGLLPRGCELAAPVPGAGVGAALTLKLGFPPEVAPGEAATWRRITAWELEARARVDAIERFVAGHVTGFERVRVGGVATLVGVRSGRRICGRATLTDGDVRAGGRHPDAVARGCWPVEVWEGGPRPLMTWLPAGASYDIPLGCLRPVALENVFAAGRCLSAEPGAAASARVVGTALATGWAAGALAARCAAGETPEAAVGALRSQWDVGSKEP